MRFFFISIFLILTLNNVYSQKLHFFNQIFKINKYQLCKPNKILFSSLDTINFFKDTMLIIYDSGNYDKELYVIEELSYCMMIDDSFLKANSMDDIFIKDKKNLFKITSFELFVILSDKTILIKINSSNIVEEFNRLKNNDFKEIYINNLSFINKQNIVQIIYGSLKVP